MVAAPVLASSRVSAAPACEGAACGLFCIGARESLEGLRVCSFCGLARASVAATDGSRSAGSGALFRRAKLVPATAATASASPPAVSVQRRELIDFCCDRQVSQRGELDLGPVDVEGGGALVARVVDDSSARFNSASISSAFTCRFVVPSIVLASDFPRPREMSCSRPSHHADG
jgi:hypothetical protein